MKKNLLILLILLAGCTTLKIKHSITKSEIFDQGFTGFMLYDPAKQKTVFANNEDKYFTPASNTKIFTFYASNKILKDSINSLNYLEKGDSLIFWGTGDPSFLHPDYENNQVLEFLKQSDKKLFHANNFYQVPAYGPGWSWSWYNYYFGPERSAMPIFGNIVRFEKKKLMDSISFVPTFFASSILPDNNMDARSYRIVRDRIDNKFSYKITAFEQTEFITDRPFVTSENLLLSMLSSLTQKEIESIDYNVVKDQPLKKLRTIPTDSLYKQMMQISDNFLAEQLLCLISDELFDSLNIESAIKYSIENLLADLPDAPQWVDGSGLSASNKFTPRSIITLLGKIKNEIPEEKIFAFFPQGGKVGTIKYWYKSDTDVPYVYAKTGSLSNTHCLSGYLLTKSNKILYFSFMHNNYIINTDLLKLEMQKVLYYIHSKY